MAHNSKRQYEYKIWNSILRSFASAKVLKDVTNFSSIWLMHKNTITDHAQISSSLSLKGLVKVHHQTTKSSNILRSAQRSMNAHAQ